MLPIRDRLPTRRTPIVNYLLIAVNVLVFVWERALLESGVSGHALVTGWGLVPARFLSSPLVEAPTIVTSMFMHDPTGFLHIGGNMLFLWIFGDNVEDALGSFAYAAFYVLAGTVAAGAQMLIGPDSLVPMVGASGAISGVLAAYGSLYPRSPVTVLNPIPFLWFVFGIFFELPAWVVILEYFVVNLLNGLGSVGGDGGGVAFFAHLGGFVAGLLLVRLFLVGKPPPPKPNDRWDGWRPPVRREGPPPRYRGW